MAMTAGPLRERIPFTAVLRGEECDRGDCPAAVQVAILLPAGPLGLCNHHWHVMEPSFLVAGLRYSVRQVGDLAA
jgi:hypothetical protein